jgi:abequosyltransferase
MSTLSICIPTKNFGAYISEAIESVIQQGHHHDIRIVILDSGSTDETRKIVESFQQHYSFIDYHFEAVAEGIDRGIQKVINLSKTTYCWLLSADDALTDGSISKILSLINQQKPDVILCNRLWCDLSLKVISKQDWRHNVQHEEIISFSNEADLMNYLQTSQSLGALFSFMSCIIVRKEAWGEAQSDEDYLKTNYAHVPRLLKMSARSSAFAYIPQYLVKARSGNDSFRSDGLLGRLLIDVKGYSRFGADLYHDRSTIQREFFAVLRREHRYLRWLKAFWLSHDHTQKAEAIHYLNVIGYPKLFACMLSWVFRLGKIS